MPEKQTIQDMIRQPILHCPCGRAHATGLAHLHIGENALAHLLPTLQQMGVKAPFVVSDSNTEEAAGRQVKAMLQQANIGFSACVLPSEDRQMLAPDEAAIGALVLQFPAQCDCILSVGSGVITDCCKILAKVSGLSQAAVATAPSMDGFASDSASMLRGGIKVTIPTPCPAAIVADTGILATAPEIMLQAGLGDMVAKMVSVAEWRMSHLITGEYYCDMVAGLMRTAVRKCMDSAQGLLSRSPEALAAMAEGLVLSGVAMSYARMSRPASGLEHYFSHMWDMMALDRHQQHALHGIQVGVGTVLTLQLFDWLMGFPRADCLPTPADRPLDPDAFSDWVKSAFGRSAGGILAGVRNFGLNDQQARLHRRQTILKHWGDILSIMKEELQYQDSLLAAMQAARLPRTPGSLGIDRVDTETAFLGARVIRDKYLLCTLIWDLGLTDLALDVIVPGGDTKLSV